MRYGLISDIHSNLEALESVIEALSREHIDRYLVIGDVIGYGADPRECVKMVQGLDPLAFIAGNHEWGVAGLLDLEYFNEYARKSIEWTMDVLDKDEIDYLKTSRIVLSDDGFTLVHGSLTEPSKFPYIIDSDDADAAMKLMSGHVCFVGHTHVAEIYYYENIGTRRYDGFKLKLEKDRKYLVNIGSVGQPRDMDRRASFAVFDTDADTVEIKRAAYDFKKTQAKILKAGLPAMLADRLSEGR